jgi:hypothetical protein
MPIGLSTIAESTERLVVARTARPDVAISTIRFL